MRVLLCLVEVAEVMHCARLLAGGVGSAGVARGAGGDTLCATL